MQYRMIVSDLDETLLNRDHKVGEENRKWIQKAREEKGMYFVPATGRIYEMIRDILMDLGLFNQKNEYVISGNGAMVTENCQNRLLYYNGLPYEDVENLFHFALDKDVCVEIFSKDTVYVYNVNMYEKNILEQLSGRFVYLDSADISFLKDEPLVKILFMHCDMDYLQSLEPMMKHLTENIQVSYSSNRYIEFNRKGVNKGEAVKWLAKMLDIDMKEVIVVGDHYNDVTMLEVAGLSVAANNAITAVKEMCDVVSDADCDEGVVAEIIKKYIYIWRRMYYEGVYD